MSDKARPGRKNPEIYDASVTGAQKEEELLEQIPTTIPQDWPPQTSEQPRAVKWPLLVGSVVLIIGLLGIGYLYGAGLIDERGSIVMAIALTLLITTLAILFWWLKRAR